MSASVADLKQLSQLLDAGLDLDAPGREAWLASLSGDAARLAPTLRALLLKAASQETDDLLQRGPVVEMAERAGEGAAAGRLVGPYRLLREIGSGGMGDVWLAERADGQLKRQVALKLPHLGWAPGLAERFAREREILSSLEHPHIARLYDAGLDAQGRPYMALEYVEGLAIDDYCSKRQVGTPQRLALLLQVAEAVAFAHSRLVIHRDLKPGNILVTAEGQVRLLDFGIAKLMEGQQAAETALTQAAGRALTLDYASPEQIRGEPIGTASDVYSLGVVAYELLSGAKPYKLKRGSAAELEEAIAAQDVPLASAIAEAAPLKKQLQGDLDAILNRALKKHVAERYATVDALAQDIRRHLAGDRVQARPDTLLYRVNRLARRYRMPLTVGTIVAASFGLAIGVGATAVVIGALLLGLAAALWQARRAREQARVARHESRRAQAVQGFMVDLFRTNSSRQSDPVKARATSARELLDIGAERLATALANEPEARLTVMQTLGDMYVELELEERAVEIDRQRVGLLRSMVGREDVRLAQALIHLANALHASGQREEIMPVLDEAKSILDAVGDRVSPLRAELLVRLAQRQHNISLARSKAYADEAIAVLRAQALVDADMLSTAQILGARACVGLGEIAEAETLYRSAIKLLLPLPDLPHFDLMTARGALADVLAQRQQFGPALQLAREAAEGGAAALGIDAPGVIIVHARWATLLHALGQRVQARQLHQCALGAVLRVKGPLDTLYTPIVRVELARAWLAEGRLTDGLKLSEAVVAVYRQHYAGSLVLGAGLRTHSALLAALGRQVEARALAEEAWVLLESGAGGAMRPWRFNRLTLDLARLDLVESRSDVAMVTLNRFEPWPDSESPPPRPDEVERALLMAMAHLQGGEVEDAFRHAQSAVDMVAQVAARGRQPGLEADASLTRGIVLLATGRHEAASSSIDCALALRREYDDPTSPWLAQAEALHGHCLLHKGEIAAARGSAARAQTIVAAYPQLAATFTEPLKELQRALRP